MITLLLLLVLPPVPTDYKLQIGDELAITIAGNINFTYSQAVSPEGIIFIQSGGFSLRSPAGGDIVPSGGTILGTVKVLGLTLDEARKLVEQEVKHYFKNISISLSIMRFEDVVYVEGGVVRPGAYSFFPGKTVRDYIGLAGGPVPSGDIENFNLTPPNNEVKGAGNLDFSPSRNSVIFVPYAYVYVKGEVNRPGNFSYESGKKVLHYIGMAGGPTERGNIKKSYVIKRDGTKVSIDKTEIEKEDIIVVSKIYLKWWQDYVVIASTATSILIAWLTLQK
ncbi:MAG: SLBB domain-containing protein [Candidatus Stahlbacteria bacterium]|nr:SLBB domain-containing protein [Candidatus Stahlbacteria bacterium]